MFSIRGLRLYFPELEPWAALSFFAPLPLLLVYLFANVEHRGLVAVALPAPFVPQSAMSLDPAALPQSYGPQPPVSAPPTGLDECFFFISLVVRLPYSSIFCQFWVFFFYFKLLLSFFLLCEEAQCVYLRLHLGFLDLF